MRISERRGREGDGHYALVHGCAPEARQPWRPGPPQEGTCLMRSPETMTRFLDRRLPTTGPDAERGWRSDAPSGLRALHQR